MSLQVQSQVSEVKPFQSCKTRAGCPHSTRGQTQIVGWRWKEQKRLCCRTWFVLCLCQVHIIGAVSARRSSEVVAACSAVGAVVVVVGRSISIGRHTIWPTSSSLRVGTCRGGCSLQGCGFGRCRSFAFSVRSLRRCGHVFLTGTPRLPGPLRRHLVTAPDCVLYCGWKNHVPVDR